MYDLQIRQVRQVPIRDLRFGHLAKVPLNARKRNRDVDDPSFAASIAAKGVIVPLLVCQSEGMFYVSDGNRRLRVLLTLVEKGELRPSDLVNVNLLPWSEGLEISLQANLQRQNMHPVDEFEAFASLAQWLTPGEIAARFGLSTRQVQQRLALGELAPEIRDAWAKGALTVEQAKCFTLGRDHQHQRDVYEKLLAEQAGLAEWRIRAELVGEATSRSQMARFVGLKAYTFAGGRLRADLFNDAEIIVDPDILDRVAAEKMQELIDAYRGHGWAWVKRSEEMPKSAYLWEKLEPKDNSLDPEMEEALGVLAEQLRSARQASGETSATHEIEERLAALQSQARLARFTADERKMSGVVLRVMPNGDLHVQSGIIWEGARRPVSDMSPAPEALTSPRERVSEDRRLVPPEIEARLDLEKTRALAELISASPMLAVRLAVAAAEGPGLFPIFIEPHGAHEGPGIDRLMVLDGQTGSRLSSVMHASDDAVLAAFAGLVGLAVDARRDRPQSTRRTGPASEESVAALVRMFQPAEYAKAMRRHFDPDIYFGGARREVAEAALVEMGVELPPPSARKADVGVKAATHSRLLGWLPAQLRHPEGQGDE